MGKVFAEKNSVDIYICCYQVMPSMWKVSDVCCCRKVYLMSCDGECKSTSDAEDVLVVVNK